MSANKKALDLLFSSLEKGAAGSSGKWELLGSTLQSGSLYNKSVREIYYIKLATVLLVCFRQMTCYLY